VDALVPRRREPPFRGDARRARGALACVARFLGVDSISV
jgi:hypothetical protein